MDLNLQENYENIKIKIHKFTIRNNIRLKKVPLNAPSTLCSIDQLSTRLSYQLHFSIAKVYEFDNLSYNS